MSASGYTSGMGFLPPMRITLDNMVTSVAASTLAAWSADTTYALNEEIIDTDRIVWRSMLDGNLGNDPSTTTGKWQNRGVENRLAMFDGSLGTATQDDDEIVVTVTPARVVTDLQLLGVRGYDVQVTMTDPVHGPLYDSGAIVMLRPSGLSHWGYFFNPIEFEPRLLISGLPAFTNASITVRIRNPGAQVRCAEMILGRSVWLGDTYWRPSIGYDEWGTKERDPWGGWKVSPTGTYSDRMQLQVLVRGTAYERTRELILPYRRTPVLWMGARGINALTIYGYITRFEQILTSHGNSDCALTIEGLEQ